MTPNLVPEEVLPDAVSANSVLFQVGVIIGPSLGGVLTFFGFRGVRVRLALIGRFSVLVATFGRCDRQRGRTSHAAGRRARRFALRGARPTVLGAISLDLFAVLFGGATALLPVYATDILHVGPAGLGVLRTAPGVGAAAIALTRAFFPIQRHVGRWMFGGVAAFGVATIAFGLSATFWMSLAVLAVMGAGDMVSVYVRHLLVQLETPGRDPRPRERREFDVHRRVERARGIRVGATPRWVGAVRAVVIGGVATLIVVATYTKMFPAGAGMGLLQPAALNLYPVTV